jgi:hypothetical protein
MLDDADRTLVATVLEDDEAATLTLSIVMMRP